MKIRYKAIDKGRYIEEVKIYDRKSHLPIFSKKVDPSVLHILHKLKEEGFKSYLVGGSVRDLLLGLSPKDFDIVTDALPRQIKIIFGKKAVIIGKRFRLVHVRTVGKNYIEVVTFRASREKSKDNNSYGSIEEDVKRRDFTINALYYNPLEEELLDYVGAMDSIRRRCIDPLIPTRLIFKEDPVRMIRLLKYAAKTNFRIPLKLRWQLLLDKKELKKVSKARLMDEMIKILHTGYSRKIFNWLLHYGLLTFISPNLAQQLKGSVHKELFDKELAKLDTKISSKVNLSKEDYVRPLKQLAKLIQRGKAITLTESLDKLFHSYEGDSQDKTKETKVPKPTLDGILEELLYPIQFTGEWEIALKNSGYSSAKDLAKLKNELSAQEFSKLSPTHKEQKKTLKKPKYVAGP